MPKRKLRVFISYSNQDKKYARNLRTKLNKEGLDVWLDKKELLPGKEWPEEISKAVEEVDVIIICLSKASINKSGFFQREIKIALDIAENKPAGTIYIIPARLDELEKDDVPTKLRNLQWVDLYGKRDRYSRLMDSLRHQANKVGAKIIKKTKVKKKKRSQEIPKQIIQRPLPITHPPQKWKINLKRLVVLGVLGFLFVVILASSYLISKYRTSRQTSTPTQIFNTNAPTFTPFQPNPSHSPTPIILDPSATPTLVPRTFLLIKHTVSSQETLSEISEEYTDSVKSVNAIQAANELKSTALSIGQVLFLPIYEVRFGDAIYLIANRFGVTQSDIIDGNNVINPDILDVGTKFVIPINCKVENCDPFIQPTP